MLACVSKGANLLSNFQPRLASFRANFQPPLASLRANFQPPLASLHPNFQPRVASLHANFQPRLASLHANFQPHVPNCLKIRLHFYLNNYLIRWEIRNSLLGRKLPNLIFWEVAVDSADILRSYGIMVTTDDGMWRLMYGHAGNHYINNQNMPDRLGVFATMEKFLFRHKGTVNVFPECRSCKGAERHGEVNHP